MFVTSVTLAEHNKALGLTDLFCAVVCVKPCADRQQRDLCSTHTHTHTQTHSQALVMLPVFALNYAFKMFNIALGSWQLL